MGNGVTQCEWRHAPEACGGFWEILKKSVRVETRHRTRRVDFRLIVEALSRCRTRWGGGRWKGQNRKIVPLTPYIEKPLNSKVIKSFVPELRSRKCFSCFEIPMFYVIYIWTLYDHFTHIRIWLWHSATRVRTRFLQCSSPATLASMPQRLSPLIIRVNTASNANTLKIVLFFSWLRFFLLHADMTSATIQK